jgi:hypothetical protein
MGRFMSPDWSSKAESVPYADFSDPQSLNLYAYVRNNPLSRVDMDGHLISLAESRSWGGGWGSSGSQQLIGALTESLQMAIAQDMAASQAQQQNGQLVSST